MQALETAVRDIFTSCRTQLDSTPLASIGEFQSLLQHLRAKLDNAMRDQQTAARQFTVDHPAAKLARVLECELVALRIVLRLADGYNTATATELAAKLAERSVASTNIDDMLLCDTFLSYAHTVRDAMHQPTATILGLKTVGTGSCN